MDCVLETVHYALGRPSGSRSPPRFRNSERSNFLEFVTEVVTKAEVRVPVLLVAVIYVHRAQPHLDIATEEWANERTFLGALILANKVRPFFCLDFPKVICNADFWIGN